MSAQRKLDWVFDFDEPRSTTPERQRRNTLANARKARMKARRNALKTVIEGLFLAWGWGMREAIRMAGWWMADRWETARSVAERYGYDFMSMEWRTA